MPGSCCRYIPVARELDQISGIRGYPCMVVSDYGTELRWNAILKWQEDSKVEWHYLAPGKPMQNGFVESFNGLNVARFLGQVQQSSLCLIILSVVFNILVSPF